jgi:hypothetical protein
MPAHCRCLRWRRTWAWTGIEAELEVACQAARLTVTNLLAQVLVAEYLDHLPLYRQEAIFERAGHLIACSNLQ